MKLAKLWKTATLAALVGIGGVASISSANAQATFQFNYNSGGRYSHRECNRFGDCYTVTCDRWGDNCYRSNYSSSNFNYNYRRGRYWVCDRYNYCAYAPYPRDYYSRNPRMGFSFGFRF